jgi:hypothetical protein
MAGEAAIEVGVEPLRQLGRELLGRARLRARSVGDLGLAGQAQAVRVLGEARAQLLDDGGAVSHQGDAVPGQLGVPGG